MYGELNGFVSVCSELDPMLVIRERNVYCILENYSFIILKFKENLGFCFVIFQTCCPQAARNSGFVQQEVLNSNCDSELLCLFST